jgi:hypothetical protein
MASARVEKFGYANGDDFSVELFILNDLPEAIEPLRVTATLTSDSKVYEMGVWETDETPASRHQKNPEILSIKIDEQKSTLLRLSVKVAGKPHMDSEYVFAAP